MPRATCCSCGSASSHRPLRLYGITARHRAGTSSARHHFTRSTQATARGDAASAVVSMAKRRTSAAETNPTVSVQSGRHTGRARCRVRIRRMLAGVRGQRPIGDERLALRLPRLTTVSPATRQPHVARRHDCGRLGSTLFIGTADDTTITLPVISDAGRGHHARSAATTNIQPLLALIRRAADGRI